MSYPIEQAFIRSPELWVPGKQPKGEMRIDWSNPLSDELKGCWLSNIPRFTIKNIAGVYADAVGGEDYDATDKKVIAGKMSSWTNSTGPSNVEMIDIAGPVLPGTGSFTILYNYYPNQAIRDNDWYLFGRRSGNAADAIYLYLQETPLKQRYWVQGLSTNAAFTGNTTIPLKTWTTGAMVFNGSQTKGYVNGNDDGSVSVTGTRASIVTNGQANYIGSPIVYTNTGTFWQRPLVGAVSYAMIWERALSDTEVKSMSLDPYQIITPA